MPRFLLAFFLIAATSAVAQALPTVSEKHSVVFTTHEPNAVGAEGDLAVRRMVNSLVMALSGKANVVDAWRTFFRPGDKIGIKVAAAGGKAFSTHRSVVVAILEGLEAAGLKRESIVVWDRDAAGLREAGFTSSLGCQVRGIEPVTGYDLKSIYSAPVLGKLIWGDSSFHGRDRTLLPEPSDLPEQLSSSSHLSRVLGEVTKIINVPTMTYSESYGVAACLYNVTIPNIDNFRRFAQAPEGVAELYGDERIAPKVVVNIVDGLVAQCAAGPRFEPNYAVPHGTLYAGTDPVAIDAVVSRQIEKWRKQWKLPPINKEINYLPAAEAMGLGNYEEDRIEVRPVSR